MGNGGLEAYLQLMKNKSKVVNACPPNKIDKKTHKMKQGGFLTTKTHTISNSLWSKCLNHLATT